MREILFRGKKIHSGDWIAGDLLHDYGDEGDAWIWIDPDARIPGYNEHPHLPGPDQVIPETVGQFTGLTDKNGKRIFEGDICTYPDGWVDYAGDGVETFSVGVVAWDEKNPSFYLTNNIGAEWDEIWDAVDEITVIGNIHDNPELLPDND